MTKTAYAIIAIFCIFTTAAQAHIHHHHTRLAHHDLARVAHHFGGHHRHYIGEVAVASTQLPHPAGCPSRAFCGCGASVEVFGHSIRDLWLAREWFRFPPADAAPGMVAVRTHHVMVIRGVVESGRALVFDANSGHGATQLHVVSLSGYAIRNPHSSIYGGQTVQRFAGIHRRFGG